MQKRIFKELEKCRILSIRQMEEYVKMKKEIHLIVGIQANGKSTLASTLFNQFGFTESVIVSKDKIRFMLMDYPDSNIDFYEEIEPMVEKIEEDIVYRVLENPSIRYVIVDETNVSRKRRNKLYKIFNEFDCEVIIHTIIPNIYQSIGWNESRKRKVPLEAIFRDFHYFQLPSLLESKKVKKIIYY